MNLHGRVPIEPLDDERLTNIERKLVVAVSDMRAPAARAPMRLLAFAGVGMAIAIAGFAGWKLRGDGAVVAPDEAETFAIHHTDRGHTVELGNAKLGAIALTSGPATELLVERANDRVVVDMKRGSIDMNIEHKPGRMVVVKAGDTEIEDVGTRFTVDYDGHSKVDVRVTEGEVRVNRAGASVDITAGFAWTVDIGKITIAQLAERRAAATGTVVAANDVQPELPEHDVTAPVQTGSAASGTGSGSGNGSSGGGSAAAGSGSGTRKVGTTNARKALLSAQVDPPDDVGTTDPKAAKAKYIEMLKTMPEGEGKARVLYSMAYVQHMAKNDGEAAHLISGLLRRKGGPTYRSALWLNVRIHCVKAFDDTCRKAAAEYVRKFPDGVHTGIADEILREIARAP